METGSSRVPSASGDVDTSVGAAEQAPMEPDSSRDTSRDIEAWVRAWEAVNGALDEERLRDLAAARGVTYLPPKAPPASG